MRHRGCSSEVERQLPKLNVVGSIPIARSNFLEFMWKCSVGSSEPALTTKIVQAYCHIVTERLVFLGTGRAEAARRQAAAKGQTAREQVWRSE